MLIVPRLKLPTKGVLGSGVIHEGHIYVMTEHGIAKCIDLKTGETV